MKEIQPEARLVHVLLHLKLLLQVQGIVPFGYYWLTDSRQLSTYDEDFLLDYFVNLAVLAVWLMQLLDMKSIVKEGDPDRC